MSAVDLGEEVARLNRSLHADRGRLVALRKREAVMTALLRELHERMMLDYDGAPDSSNKWMGHFLTRIDEVLGE